MLVLMMGMMFWMACKTTRSNDTADCPKLKKLDTEELVDSTRLRQMNFTWFNAKAKVNYDDGKMTQGVTANIRMQRDSVIWVSITAIMGYEAARVRITPTTFELINNLDKSYTKEPLSKIKNYIPVKADLRLIQDLLVGNYLWSTEGRLKHKAENCLYVLTEDNTNIENTFWIEPGRFTISKMETREKEKNQTVNLVASDYNYEDGYWFPSERKILFTGSNTVKVDMKYGKVRWNEPTSFPFNAGKYED
ncbi:hypothetical protein BH09BAC1_BH09BAC1_20930 [soil metagenome]